MEDVPADQAARYRKAMVDALLATGEVSSPRVAAALSRVPREAFVPARGRDAPPGPAGLSSVYDLERALAVRRAPAAGGAGQGPVTSTISAPRVVGAMLELLGLEEGMHLLEVGLGSGYNAALLRELVGPQGRVVSVDIDEGLVAETAGRLGGAGYSDILLVAGDGYFGHQAGAPFDRVVVTVGCPDLSPHWLEQLVPGGLCLVPLQHADWHPLTMVTVGAGHLGGRVVGNTGFLPLRGAHAGPSPWPEARAAETVPVEEWAPLAPRLASRLRPDEAGQEPGLARDLAFLVALEDGRAGFLRLSGGGSTARLNVRHGRVGWSGRDGLGLAEQLVAMGERWLALGCPRAADYVTSFGPLGPRPREGPHRVPGEAARWVVDRVDYRQTFSLAASGPPSGPGR
jgi:protein-L-isoaspartate(D-aspartate) O-methyltransferase